MVPSFTDVVYTPAISCWYSLRESSLIAWVRDMMRPAPCGGRVTPLGIAFAECQDASVTHVDGNENLSPLCAAMAPFSENQFIDIDVVVNGMKRFAGLKAGSFQQFFGNLLPVQSSKLLAKSHIMQILLRYFPETKQRSSGSFSLRCSDFACWMAFGFLFAVLLPCILL